MGNGTLTNKAPNSAKYTKRTTDETQIRQLIDGWAKALRAKDAGGVVSHQAAGFIHFSLAPPLITAADGRQPQSGG